MTHLKFSTKRRQKFLQNNLCKKPAEFLRAGFLFEALPGTSKSLVRLVATTFGLIQESTRSNGARVDYLHLVSDKGRLNRKKRKEGRLIDFFRFGLSYFLSLVPKVEGIRKERVDASPHNKIFDPF